MGKRRTFVVEGEGIFPLDMLRYDKCWPATSDDVNAIVGEGLRRVSLVSNEDPTWARWDSFSWTVLNMKTAQAVQMKRAGYAEPERLVLSKKG